MNINVLFKFINENNPNLDCGLWVQIITGFIVSLLASAVVIFVQILYSNCKKRRYKKYAGQFECFEKEDISCAKSISKVEITVKGNILITNTTRCIDNDPSTGSIVMNLSSEVYGEGPYYHTGSNLGWGYSTLVVKDVNEFLVHTRYYQDGKERMKAYKWKRIPNPETIVKA